jgi:cyclopropane fatty-acyl-phospholipid synthase-like methyltransferase
MTLRLSDEQTAKLRAAAERDGVSMHSAVLKAVDDYLDVWEPFIDQVTLCELFEHKVAASDLDMDALRLREQERECVVLIEPLA